MKINYQKELEQILEKVNKCEKTPRLLLHSCCAPCSSYVLEYLSNYFEITINFYNPNITFKEEYQKRLEEQRIFNRDMKVKNEIKLIEGRYDVGEFFECIEGLEDSREGGERCFKCYRLRLEDTAKKAKEMGFDYFSTVLSISPLKNSQKINEIGKELEEKYGVKFLTGDFKKKNGYKRSVELSKEHNLYRQDYCGCVFSKVEKETKEK
ncbi:epoxyqueuosine reductase QueH [uncultured Ilyobacter sp.]|uniref:epoxyqueuosine reductase QueH n=1 Tax=uncultured Ilyobacter sp. TaxID=544433 RepID=UPI0029C90B35|nr:epoxyqueuosine reductase QueH [uncultured Ilyobacter sp.]